MSQKYKLINQSLNEHLSLSSLQSRAFFPRAPDEWHSLKFPSANPKIAKFQKLSSEFLTFLHCNFRHIVIYFSALALAQYSGHHRMLHPPPAPPLAASNSGSLEHYVRLPRRILHQIKQHRPHDGPAVEPRAFEVETLPSTPQLNAIMDRAMGKVKSMVRELENEKGTEVFSMIYICEIRGYIS